MYMVMSIAGWGLKVKVIGEGQTSVQKMCVLHEYPLQRF